jgi:hypothetical protein
MAKRLADRVSVRDKYSKNPNIVRDRHRLKRYGLTAAEYAARLYAQNNCCALCDKEVSEQIRPLAVDHDHDCCPGRETCGKCVRDLLCDSCNLMLGGARDSIELLQKAITYLEKWKIK